MKVRRVVTGHNANGDAVFVNDELVDPTTAALLPGVEFHRVWGADAPQQFPDAGAMPAARLSFPAARRFSLWILHTSAVGDRLAEGAHRCGSGAEGVRREIARPGAVHGAGCTGHAHHTDRRHRFGAFRRSGA